MNVSVKWCKGQAGILRIHPKGGYGDDYAWCCMIEQDGTTAILHGAMDAPEDEAGKSLRKVIAAALKMEGFTRVKWMRQGRGWREFNL